VNGFKRIGGYDPRTGKQRWTMRGGGDIPVPTPLVSGDLIFITNAHGGMAPIYAIRTSATGDITPAEGSSSNDQIAWSKRGMGSYMQTPLVYGDHLYVCRDNGVLTVFDARSGEKVAQRRLGTGRSGFTASAVAADGKIYYTSEEGDVHVLRAGPEVETLATNPLGEVAMATPAISEGVLYFRTQGHLVAIGEKTTADASNGHGERGR
jgi:outer membrane protein assembly factor BamB